MLVVMAIFYGLNFAVQDIGIDLYTNAFILSSFEFFAGALSSNNLE